MGSPLRCRIRSELDGPSVTADSIIVTGAFFCFRLAEISGQEEDRWAMKETLSASRIARLASRLFFLQQYKSDRATLVHQRVAVYRHCSTQTESERGVCPAWKGVRCSRYFAHRDAVALTARLHHAMLCWKFFGVVRALGSKCVPDQLRAQSLIGFHESLNIVRKGDKFRACDTLSEVTLMAQRRSCVTRNAW